MDARSKLVWIGPGLALLMLVVSPWLAINNPTWAGLLMFPPLLALLFFGFPVAFSLMGIALFYGFIRFGDAAIGLFVAKVDDVASNYVLGAVPLFIFMGSLLERSGVAERLFEAIHMWTRRLPGGLAIGTVMLCVVFAASTGIVGATETVVGLLAIPVMMRYAYNNTLIAGTICAGGSLGTIIPPSVVVILLGPTADVSIGDLFAGMIIPGLMLAACYMLYILVRCTLRPEDGRRLPPDENDPPFTKKLWITATALVPPFFLIALVLGSILGGLATPTEAAACGAVGSTLMTLAYRTLSFSILQEALVKTVLIQTQNLLQGAELSPWATLAIVLLIAFVAGFVLDLISLMLIVVPIAIPIVTGLSYYDLGVGDIKIWFCICFLIMIQTSYLTPPMAPAIFYLRGIAPPEIRLVHMYRGVVPFILLHLVVLAAVLTWPQLALWLPTILFRGFG
jgi:TRAP-type mannitol/chloroaromatic compound transport system permease large subunit